MTEGREMLLPGGKKGADAHTEAACFRNVVVLCLGSKGAQIREVVCTFHGF